MEHEFTPQIQQKLAVAFGPRGEDVFAKSLLLQYLNIKMRSATRGTKARGSFANLYAVYVLVEDYLKNNFHQRDDYADYAGVRFTDLFQRQRALPFGNKLQNHALNHRLNEEFKKYFPDTEYLPILRDPHTNRYWINENLLKVRLGQEIYQLASVVLELVEAYIQAKRDAFEHFLATCEHLKSVAEQNDGQVAQFIASLLAPQVDARIFEVVSYAILKFYYCEKMVYFGFDQHQLQAVPLALYKTGRTNANDGGIDFVMRPLGRFFQVTETLDVRKYFLDIDKVERYPISFVIKSEEAPEILKNKLRAGAQRQYAVNVIVEKYMSCIEEIINLETLRQRLQTTIVQGDLRNVLDEIIRQSRVEFNYEPE